MAWEGGREVTARRVSPPVLLAGQSVRERALRDPFAPFLQAIMEKEEAVAAVWRYVCDNSLKVELGAREPPVAAMFAF